MAVLNKTLVAHNLHKYSMELEKAFEEGWRLNKSVAARRSLGNKFSVQLIKLTEGDIQIDTVDITVDGDANVSSVDVENKVEESPKVEEIVKVEEAPKIEEASVKVTKSKTTRSTKKVEAE